MAQFLKSLTLKNYRSFEAERVVFDNPTFFVGQNGSGKSNLADALLFLGEITALPLSAALNKRGSIRELAFQKGREMIRTRRERNESNASPSSVTAVIDPEPISMGLAAEFGQISDQIESVRYGFEIQSDWIWNDKSNDWFPGKLKVRREQCIIKGSDGHDTWFDRSAGSFRSSIAGLSPSLDPSSLGLPIVGGDTRFAPIIRALEALDFISVNPRVIGRPQPSSEINRLATNGWNAAGILKLIERQSPDDVARICEILRSIVPDIVEVEAISTDRYEYLEFMEKAGDGRRTLLASSMSDGTLHALGLILAVFQPQPPAFLMFEEPEATIHPGALGAVMDLIHHASQMMQVVVTTHSPDLLEAKWVEDRHLRVVTREAGSSRVKRISEGARRVLQKHLMGAGELLRSNALQAESATVEVDQDMDLFVPIP